MNNSVVRRRVVGDLRRCARAGILKRCVDLGSSRTTSRRSSNTALTRSRRGCSLWCLAREAVRTRTLPVRRLERRGLRRRWRRGRRALETRRRLGHLVLSSGRLVLWRRWLRGQTSALTSLTSHYTTKEIISNANRWRWSRGATMLGSGHARLRRCASPSGIELTAKQNNFLIISISSQGWFRRGQQWVKICCLLILDVHMGLLQLIDLVPDKRCLLDLLLDYRTFSRLS